MVFSIYKSWFYDLKGGYCKAPIISPSMDLTILVLSSENFLDKPVSLIQFLVRAF